MRHYTAWFPMERAYAHVIYDRDDKPIHVSKFYDSRMESDIAARKWIAAKKETQA